MTGVHNFGVDVRHLVHRRHLLVIALAALFLGQSALGQNVAGCGSLQNPFGPFDYRDPDSRGQPLQLVESAHFTPEVEALVRGKSGYVVGDLDYTLRAFPNHHRALNSIARYALAGNKFWINPDVRSADCYFRRAIAFRADDGVVRMLYANYLAKRGEFDQAQRQYEEALRLEPLNAEVNYNFGLFWIGRGEISKAKDRAAVAYAGGYPLLGLKKRIAEAESGQVPGRH